MHYQKFDNIISPRNDIMQIARPQQRSRKGLEKSINVNGAISTS